MKIFVLPLLLAFAPLYEASMDLRMGGEWTIVRDTNAAPIGFSTNPSNPICRMEMTSYDAIQGSHAVYKARVLPGTVWSHVSAYGDTVIAKSIDSTHVQVMAADSDPIDPSHAACVVTLTQTSPFPEVEELEASLLDAASP